jgi:predicted O-linked N-acetylglucosamine transferase (SPINDLY family)
VDTQSSAEGAADRLIAQGERAETGGDLRAACACYREAVDAAPGYAKAHLNLGIGLEATDDADGAIAAYELALAIDPKNVYANYNLGKLLYTRGALSRVEVLLRTALECKPVFPEAKVVLAGLYEEQGKLDAAAAALVAALEQKPDYAGALYNYGLILRKQGKLEAAANSLSRAIKIAPDMLPAYAALGPIQRGLARIEESVETFRAARKIAPERLDMLSEELLTLNYSEDVSNKVLFDIHRTYGAQIESAYLRRFETSSNTRDPERCLRIGYVSGDFYRHPVALFLIPVLELHDRSSCEIYCYSTGIIEDEVTRQIRGLTNAWRHATTMTDTELADEINKDGIDILVDLAGHSGTVRLGVFAQQPAPVQVAWLGYLNTTGMTRMQYRLCDGYSDPPELSDSLHTEILYRLPNSQWCYRSFISIDPSETPPFLKNGFITFGSFNHMAKLSKTVRRYWSEILRLLPSSRLIFVGIPEGHAREDLLRYLEDTGVSLERVQCVPYVTLYEYFQWFNAVDIALDTTPYSGGTSTCDALWMGVPVVTIPGSRSVSRSAASILSAIGLSEWIASTPEHYIRKAVEFAQQEAVITNLRKTLRHRMRESPLMDEPRFVRDIENAYRNMWRAWCNGTVRR